MRRTHGTSRSFKSSVDPVTTTTGMSRVWACAAELRRRSGAPMHPADRRWFEPSVGAARAALGDRAFEAAWAEGARADHRTIVPLAGREAVPR